MKQVTVISGKGGTGKTTIAAAFASLAENPVLADCDCDAPDLQLLLDPTIRNQEEYVGSATAIRSRSCSMCGRCQEVCRFNAIDEQYSITEAKCEGCGACVYACPEDAIELRDETTGTVYESRTRFGPMVHAELEIGEEATGKMVTEVRRKAQAIAGNNDVVIVDGSPGIGCPVIASIKGVDHVLVVAEPTVSGMHDLKRVLEVTDQFDIDTSVCVNKADINPGKAEEILEYCRSKDVSVRGQLPYDDVATEAMIEERTVLEHSDSELSSEIRSIWHQIEAAASVV